MATWESLLPEIWGCSILWKHKRTIHESFLYKIVFSNNWLKFSPSKVFHYTVLFLGDNVEHYFGYSIEM